MYSDYLTFIYFHFIFPCLLFTSVYNSLKLNFLCSNFTELFVFLNLRFTCTLKCGYADIALCNLNLGLPSAPTSHSDTIFKSGLGFVMRRWRGRSQTAKGDLFQEIIKQQASV
jgi:hypothetical protein